MCSIARSSSYSEIHRTIYFCGYFDEPATSKVFSGSGTTLSRYDSGNSASGTNRVGGAFTFTESNVTSRVGISFISSGKACQFVEEEIPPGTGLQDLVSKAKGNWNSEVFSKVQTSEVLSL